MRLPLFIVAILTSGTAGLAAASIVIGDTPPRPAAAEHDDARAGSSRIAVRTADPSGGPDWAVRSYDGATGLRCVAVGRVDERRFGRLDSAGRVTEVAVDDSGSCADPTIASLQLAVSRSPRAAAAPATSVLFGTIDRTRIESIEVIDPRGRIRQTDLSGGAVLIVSNGGDAGGVWTIVARFKDGREESSFL